MAFFLSLRFDYYTDNPFLKSVWTQKNPLSKDTKNIYNIGKLNRK